MNHIIKFQNFTPLNEKINQITSNWFIISDEGSFDKKDEGGYLVFNQNGLFSILYKKKNTDSEEARIDFYVSKESSPDSKSICDCQIINKSGDTISRKTFEDVNSSNIFEIVAVFFDYSDLEDVSKDEADRFILGLSKSIIEVYKSKYSDQLPSSFKAFFKYISDSSNNPDEEIKIDEVDNSEFVVLIEKFIKYFKDYL
jgi:hypothetical protein